MLRIQNPNLKKSAQNAMVKNILLRGGDVDKMIITSRRCCKCRRFLGFKTIHGVAINRMLDIPIFLLILTGLFKIDNITTDGLCQHCEINYYCENKKVGGFDITKWLLKS